MSLLGFVQQNDNDLDNNSNGIKKESTIVSQIGFRFQCSLSFYLSFW